ncbi:MAG: MobF family relaxase [Opitutaceae bacterium]|nr:MobF family relaxase [Opitutaceae bacterium]
MLTIRTCKIFSHALGEYLRQADYYSQGMKVEGQCFGQLCEAVGLVEGATISDEAFERVASNHHAGTAEQLTERMAAARRAGYDATFNAPKSVSIQACIGSDERLVTAHQTAVTEALRELETLACHQDGRGINKRYVTSGQIAAAVFRHGESRALDPHLHSHAFVFNVVRGDSSSRLLALESSNIFERARYLTEVYRNTLAREVQKIGYAIERREHGFELAGISSNLLERFSKRAKERDAAIAVREAELGRELSRDEIAVLVRENRAKKHYELTPDDVRQRQFAQVNDEELRQLHALRDKARLVTTDCVSLAVAIERAVEHVFERKTVAPVHELTAEILRQSYGKHPLSAIKEAVVGGNHSLLHADGKVTTRAALDLERALVAQLNTDAGTLTELGYLMSDAGEKLSKEQRTAVGQILNSGDRAVVLRGRAGTGKTHALASAIEGMASVKREVACFAPSTQAVEILRRDGDEQAQTGRIAAASALRDTQTVQRLLVDPVLQESIKHKAVVIDEYGLLSLRQLKAVVDLAEKHHTRLVLVGDSGQHKSVEAGDAARIVERESRVTVAELHEVRRQSANPAYRVAAEALAAGKIAEGVTKLDAMGAVVEVENPTARRVQMVNEWFAASQETKLIRTKAGVQERAKTALMVAPTWEEIDALNVHAREKLRAAGKLAREEQTISSLRAKDWTKAQQKDVRNYQPGDVLATHKATKHFAKGDELHVVRKEKRRLIVTRRGEEISVSPRQSGLAWTVCEERPLAVTPGERLRLRAVSHTESADGKGKRLANGTSVIVRSVESNGRLALADGSTLHTRQVVHGYAMTSHAAQGLTVDKVFVAGAISREGLYVSATRGREGIRVFVPDREAFLDAAGLRSEARMSALEFVRQHALGTDLRSVLARGWRHLMHVRACFLAVNPRQRPGETMVKSERIIAEAVTPTVRSPRPPEEDHSPRPVIHHQQAAPRMRMGF